jgi:hypothetical protein
MEGGGHPANGGKEQSQSQEGGEDLRDDRILNGHAQAYADDGRVGLGNSPSAVPICRSRPA